VCFHGFPQELQGAWDGLATIAADHGLSALASYGLDSSGLSGALKGTLMGDVLARPTCAAGLLDMEGAWDDSDKGKPGDVTDKGDALDMCAALRNRAPNALIGDQCWFAIDSHGELRARPIGQDVFEGFPADEVARKAVNWRQFRQAYCNHAEYKARWGTLRYRKVFDWMARDWSKLEAPFKRAGLHYAPGVTIQGYGWDDMPWNLVDCLLQTCITDGQPVIVWCDYDATYGYVAPSPVVVACIKALAFLRARGFAPLGRTPGDVVRAYQADYNRTAARPVAVDGKCGPGTLATMGLPLP